MELESSLISYSGLLLIFLQIYGDGIVDCGTWRSFLPTIYELLATHIFQAVRSPTFKCPQVARDNKVNCVMNFSEANACALKDNYRLVILIFHLGLFKNRFFFKKHTETFINLSLLSGSYMESIWIYLAQQMAGG